MPTGVGGEGLGSQGFHKIQTNEAVANILVLGHPQDQSEHLLAIHLWPLPSLTSERQWSIGRKQEGGREPLSLLWQLL